MRQMFNILVLFPEHLNLNGDAANAGILARRMNWYGLDSAIEFHSLGDPIPSVVPDFVLIGHGSEAAWLAIDEDFARLWPTLKSWIDAGVPGLAVNSGQELLHSLQYSVFDGVLESADRVSKFEVADASSITPESRVLGYRNTIFETPAIEIAKNFVGTALHGPVLAKNAWLADWFISKITGARTLEATQVAKTDLDRVAELERCIWQLEEQLASE